MTRFDGPDCRLNVEIVGTGDPVTLFAHGITGSADELVPLAERIPGTRVLLEFRGHGQSESPPTEAGYDHPAIRRDLEWAADRFSARNTVALSMGAGALMNLLADEPDRFDKLVLVTPASIDEPNAGADPLFLDLADRLERGEDVLQVSLDGAAELIARDAKWEGEIRDRVSRMNAGGMVHALRAHVQGRPPVVDVSTLKRVTAPVLILAHAEDPIHDIVVAERLAAIFPDARMIMWEHPLEMFDDQATTSELIAEFLTA